MRAFQSVQPWVLAMVTCLAMGLPEAAAAADPSTDAPSTTSSVEPQQSTTVQEVYVTARKSTERLIDVPVAISDVGPAALDKYVTHDLTQLSQQVPDLNLELVSSGQGGAIAIRGLGSGIDPGTSQVVSVNFDDIPVNNARFLRSEMFDEADVEVLKGPQSLFFGKNSPAGVIAVNSVNPGQNFDGYVTAGGSPEYGKEYVEGAVTIPVNDTLSIRLAGRFDHENGFLTNVGGPEPNPFECVPSPSPVCTHPISPGNAQGSTVNDYTEYAGRVTVLWTPNDRFSALLKASYANYRDNGDVWDVERLCSGPHPIESVTGINAVLVNSPCTLGTTVSIGSWIPELAKNWPDQLEGGRPFSHFDPDIISLNLTYKAGDLTFTNLTGEVNYAAITQGNSDDSDFNAQGGENSEWSNQFTDEFRVSSNFNFPVQFVAGAYVELGKLTYEVSSSFLPEASGLLLNLGEGYGVDPRCNCQDTYVSRDPQTDHTYSGYGELIWKITPDLILEGGGRYISETKQATVENVFVNETILPFLSSLIFLPEGDVQSATINATNFSPDVDLTYKPTPDMTFYAAYRTGFQSGGLSNPGVVGPLDIASALTFKPEIAKGEEAGWKFELFGHTLTGDVSIYNYNYTDLQVQSGRIVTVSENPPIQSVIYSISNAATAYTRGIEFEGNWATPLKGFGINWFLNYNKAIYVSYPQAPCADTFETPTSPEPCVAGAGGLLGVDLSGKPLANAPLWTARLGFTYDRPITDKYSFGLTLDANYRSSVYLAEPTTGFFNVPESCVEHDIICPLWLINASARVYTSDGRWELGVIGTNLANKLYVIGGGSPLGTIDTTQLDAAIGNPLEVIIQLKYHFH